MSSVEVEVWVDCQTPVLLNRATEEALSGSTRSNTPGDRPDPRDVAEAAIYRLPDRQIAMPGGAFARMLREAGGSHKAKGSRKSLKYLVPAGVIVLDDLCGFYLNDRKTKITDFEVDSRPVTIPATKGRVMRHRARLNEWSVRVHLRINERILDEKTIRMLFDEGISTIGICDYRPVCGGPFGVGTVGSWKHVSEAKSKTQAQKRNGGLRPDAPAEMASVEA